MTSTRRNYPAALKVKIALAALREDTPLSDLSVKFGVHATVINRWKREALQSLEERVAKDHTSVLKELHAKIGELIIEKDFLEQVWGRSGIKGAKK